MKIKIVYMTAGGEVTVDKVYRELVDGPTVIDRALANVVVSGPFPVETMLAFRSWVHSVERVKTEKEKQALLPEGLEFATEIWSEIS